MDTINRTNRIPVRLYLESSFFPFNSTFLLIDKYNARDETSSYIFTDIPREADNNEEIEFVRTSFARQGGWFRTSFFSLLI